MFSLMFSQISKDIPSILSRIETQKKEIILLPAPISPDMLAKINDGSAKISKDNSMYIF
jgi:hypothetical protein